MKIKIESKRTFPNRKNSNPTPWDALGPKTKFCNTNNFSHDTQEDRRLTMQHGVRSYIEKQSRKEQKLKMRMKLIVMIFSIYSMIGENTGNSEVRKSKTLEIPVQQNLEALDQGTNQNKTKQETWEPKEVQEEVH